MAFQHFTMRFAGMDKQLAGYTNWFFRHGNHTPFTIFVKVTFGVCLVFPDPKTSIIILRLCNKPCPPFSIYILKIEVSRDPIRREAAELWKINAETDRNIRLRIRILEINAERPKPAEILTILPKKILWEKI